MDRGHLKQCILKFLHLREYVYLYHAIENTANRKQRGITQASEKFA